MKIERSASSLAPGLVRAERGLAVAVLALGLAVMAGWLLGVEALKNLLPGLASMTFNTALGFALAGAALCCREKRTARLALGGAVALLGALSLGETLAGRDFGIDQIFVRVVVPAGTTALYPGRMSPATAVCFFLCGTALVLLGARHAGGRRAAELLAIAAGAAGAVALLGYASGAQHLYTVPGFVSVAPHTAAGFVLLAAGLLCAAPRGILAFAAEARRAGSALWVGLGVLMALLLVVGFFSAAHLGEIAAHFRESSEVIERRIDAAKELEINALKYVLEVRAALAGSAAEAAEAADNARQAARHQANYERLARTPRQRELAARFAAQWQEIHTFGQTLLAAGAATPAELERLRSLRVALEAFLDDEMQPDTVAAFEAAQVATVRAIQRTGGLTSLLFIGSIVIALVTSGVVARAVFGAQAGLREHEERLRQTLDAAPVGMLKADEEGVIVMVNTELERLFGYGRAELVGQKVETLMPARFGHGHPTEREGFTKSPRARAMGAGRDLFGRRKDGSEFAVEIGLSPIETPEGMRVIASVIDITERKRAEAGLREAKEEAERASRAKDGFLAALSHELRTPLTPVLMSAAALRDDEHLPAEAREQLAMMHRNIDLEARLIDDLLDLTRIARGKLALRAQPCDGHSLITRAREIIRDEAQAKGITLTSELAAEKCGLVADPARFQQIVWNLLKNAVRFTSRGGRIAIRTRNVADASGEVFLRLEIEDSGIGIDAAALEKIFAPFEQAAREGEHRFGGLGLGLAIARAIAEMHGGTIRAESAGLGAGATFIVELPGATEPPAGASEPAAASPARQDAARLRLLVVEDHEPTRAVLARLLQRSGHEVTLAASKAEALDAADRAASGGEPFDLVISDIGLPDGTGIELMEALRARHGLSGIALSGYGMEDDHARSRAAGFIAHLVKPVDFDHLRRALAEARAANSARG